MGVIKHFSSSSHDRNEYKGLFHRSSDNRVERVITNTETKYESLPNPRPENYKILKSKQLGNYLVIEIQYLDCINYEGKKILVFNSTLDLLEKQKLIDPHFSENKNYISPIARFEPTKQGWINACMFINTLNSKS